MAGLDGGAFFSRLVGQLFASEIAPGIFAVVGAGAFLAGVTRMTIGFCIVMFELTRELEYVIPHIVVIDCVKWVADALSKKNIYDLAQPVSGHPFLSADDGIANVAEHEAELTERLIPPSLTILELSLHVPSSNIVPTEASGGKVAFPSAPQSHRFQARPDPRRWLSAVLHCSIRASIWLRRTCTIIPC
jgi:chloride channel 3/4/5